MPSPRQGISALSRLIGVALGLPVVVATFLLVAGCSSAFYDKQLKGVYSRQGETMTTACPIDAVTNAVAAWAKTLTNGYALYGDKEARRNPALLADDPATLFIVDKGDDLLDQWGPSSCLPSPINYYSARIIIRVMPASEGTKISVAIHGSRLAKGSELNVHTFRLNDVKTVDVRPCPADERQVLKSIASELKRTKP